MGANKQAAIRRGAAAAEQPVQCMECGGPVEDELLQVGICMACVRDDDEPEDDDAPPAPGSTLTIGLLPGKTKAQSMAAHMLRPALQSGVTAWQWNKGSAPGLDVNGVIECMELAAGPSADGLTYCEAVLLSQVHALDAIANELFRRAAVVQSVPQFESYMQLGLKAQAHCRAAVTAYADIKQPRQTAFVKQANIAHGPQQVNNGVAHANDAGRTTAGSAGTVDVGAPGVASITVQGTEALAAAKVTGRSEQATPGGAASDYPAAGEICADSW